MKFEDLQKQVLKWADRGGKVKNIDEIVENQLIELRKNDKYQQALNDVISNAGTDFKTKNDSFYLLQELIDKNLMKKVKNEI